MSIQALPHPSSIDLPSLCLEAAERSSQPEYLEDLFNHSSSQTEDSWRLVDAYILWRLSKTNQLINFLYSLPDSFHLDSQYWVLLGLALKSSQNSADIATAKLAFSNAISISPERSDVYYNLANLLIEESPSESISLYLASLNIAKFEAHVWHNLGLAFFEFNSPHNAIICFKISLQMDAGNPSCYCNLGLSYLAVGSTKSAEISFEISTLLNPRDNKSKINLANIYLSRRHIDSAISLLSCIPPDSSESQDALFNLSLCHLLTGKYLSGWSLYQSRFNTQHVPPSCFPTCGKLISNSSELFSANETIVVWAEQGIGDAIQFARYLYILCDLGLPFEFHCQPSLLPFFASYFTQSINLRPIKPSNSSRDRRPHLPLLNCPSVFSTELSTIPSTLPIYCSPATPLPPHLQIPEPPGGISIGLVWASNPDNTKMYRNKSISLGLLMPVLMGLVEADLASLHSLQVGDDSKQFESYLPHPSLYDWSPILNDFKETADIICQLDLVISVDTAVAHLAASLSKPTWLLLPFDSDYRWLRDRSDSPWYPGIMKLFRQSSHSEWSGVIDQLRRELDNLTLLDFASLVHDKYQ